jgi:hypothetical protein
MKDRVGKLPTNVYVGDEDMWEEMHAKGSALEWGRADTVKPA